VRAAASGRIARAGSQGLPLWNPGSLVTLDPGATKREIARSFPVQTRGHYRRREALDPQRQQRGRQASEAARHKRKGVISAEAAHRARRETRERAADLMGGEDLGDIPACLGPRPGAGESTLNRRPRKGDQEATALRSTHNQKICRTKR
jgi:hypothetical protein